MLMPPSVWITASDVLGQTLLIDVRGNEKFHEALVLTNSGCSGSLDHIIMNGY